MSGFLNRLAQENERLPDAAKQMAALHGLKVAAGPQGPVISVIVELNPGKTPNNVNRDLITAAGAQIDASSKSLMRIRVPIGRMHLLDTHPDISKLREPIPCVASSLGMGSNISESINLTGAADFQNAGIIGTGIKVAVVDLGFIGLSATISAGDLPASTVIVDLPGTNDNPIEAGTNHGVGVAEHVMDMAPGATLYCIKVGDEIDLQNAADYLRDNGIRVANHSVGWVNSSYYEDTGPINAIFNNSRDIDGVFWTVSAGNNAIRHWRGGWSDTSPVNNILNFTASDERMDLTSGSSSVSLFLNWNQYGNSVTDLDIYVMNKNGAIVAQGVNPQTGLQDPAEVVGFSYLAAQAPYRIQVQRYSGPTVGLDITIFSFYNNLEYAMAAGSLMDPADAHGAFSVGAVNQANWSLNPPPLESFSSRGPTVDGRIKPDITSPDATTSRTYGAQNSYGTSFSSPTTAGAAALLLAETPSRTASDVATLLSAMAIDVGAVGPDNSYGAGKLHIEMQPVDTISPTLIGAVSRKLHDGAGEFDLPLPLSGAGVECRQNGPTKIIFTCDEPIMAIDGQPDANEILLSAGNVDSVTIIGQELTAEISGSSNQSCLTMTLAGIADLAGNPLSGDSDVSVRVLLGDATKNGEVTVSDQLLVKSKVGSPLDSLNAHCDLNLSGTITITDQLLAKNQIGSSTACP